MHQNNPIIISARQLRSNLKHTLDTNLPSLIGHRWDIRAIILPLPFKYHEPRAARRHKNATAKAQFKAALIYANACT